MQNEECVSLVDVDSEGDTDTVARIVNTDRHNEESPPGGDLQRELLTYYPVFWFLLPEGLERDALRKQQEAHGYFNH
jgi:hypothetical protein